MKQDLVINYTGDKDAESIASAQKFIHDNADMLIDYRDNFWKKLDDIDPDGVGVLFDMIYGWFLGKGLEPSTAHDFALFVYYKTDMG